MVRYKKQLVLAMLCMVPVEFFGSSILKGFARASGNRGLTAPKSMYPTLGKQPPFGKQLPKTQAQLQDEQRAKFLADAREAAQKKLELDVAAKEAAAQVVTDAAEVQRLQKEADEARANAEQHKKKVKERVKAESEPYLKVKELGVAQRNLQLAERYALRQKALQDENAYSLVVAEAELGDITERQALQLIKKQKEKSEFDVSQMLDAVRPVRARGVNPLDYVDKYGQPIVGRMTPYKQALDQEANRAAVAVMAQGSGLNAQQIHSVANAFRLLGVPPMLRLDSSDEGLLKVVDASMKTIALRSHPDKTIGMDDEERKQSEEEFKAASAARDLVKAFVQKDFGSITQLLIEDKKQMKEISFEQQFEAAQVLAQSLLDSAISVVSFQAVESLSIDAQVTPGFMGMVQVCLWNLINNQYAKQDPKIVFKVIELVHNLK